MPRGIWTGPGIIALVLAVIGVGILHGLIGPGLVLNPWWGTGEAPAGLPVFNSLILSFLAPALLLAATVRRRARPDEAWSRGWLVAAVVFGLLWILLVLRHLFHGAKMDGAPVERAETCVYAVLALLTAWALVRYRFPGKHLVNAIVDLPFALPTAVAGIALAALWPALWQSSLRFRLANTSWRGLRFRFTGDLADAAARFSARRK